MTFQRIRLNEGSIALPPGYEDRTTNLFVPADPQTQPNLSIARDRLNDGETLPDYVGRQLRQMKSTLAGFQVLDQTAAVLGHPDQAGLMGIRVDTRFKANGKLVHQRQAAFVPGYPDAATALIFTIASPKPLDEVAGSLWHAWLSGFDAATNA